MDGGIYQIKNKVNGKCYIGRTKCFNKRFYQYDYDYRKRKTKHINTHLLNAMLKYGYDSFEFNIIEYCDVEYQCDREYYWMQFFKSFDREFGYNLRQDVGGNMITHPETSEKISNRLKKEWELGLRDGHADKLKVSWDFRSRDDQSKLMTKNLTKWMYIIDDEILTYRELKNKGLHGVLGKFCKYKVNKVTFKGVVIERIQIENTT